MVTASFLLKTKAGERKMYNDELYHYGVLGMKWGVRRYQNKDGSLTPAGRKKLYKEDRKELEKKYKKADDDTLNYFTKARNYYVFDSDKPIGDEKAARSWKNVYDAHETAVKSSRDMLKFEKDFIEKYGDYKISGLFGDRDAISRGKSKIAAMGKYRLTYAEGASGGFFNFVPGPEGNMPREYYKLK